MKLRRLWLAGLIGLLILALTSAQIKNKDNTEESEGAKAEGAPAGPTRPPLTGNPQIDYIHDPNLPHELLGYDLSDYPFYNKLPKSLLESSYNFSCEERHDGFYASIPHKCQVYHNCLFNQRYDFLCANFTVFDQKNFICHYVSEVDCEGSEKHYDRNDFLYETTTTTTTTPVPPQIIYVQRPPPLNGPGRIRANRPRQQFKRPGGKRGPGRRTTTTTQAPDYYDYYYNDYYDYYNEYYEYDDKSTTTTTTTTSRPRRRPVRPRSGDRPGRRPGGRPGGLRERQRTRLGPGRGDETTSRRGLRLQDGGGARDQNLPQDFGGRRRRPNRPRQRRKKPTTTTTEATQDYYYYDDYYDYDTKDESTSNTATTTTKPTPSRRNRPSRPRADSRPLPADDQVPAATVAGASAVTDGDRGSSAPRVNIRRKPLVGSRQPQEPSQDSSGPKFPPRRSQQGEDIPSEAPATVNDPASPSVVAEGEGDATGVRPRVRRPRLGRGSRTSSTVAPAHQDYDYY